MGPLLRAKTALAHFKCAKRIVQRAASRMPARRLGAGTAGCDGAIDPFIATLAELLNRTVSRAAVSHCDDKIDNKSLKERDCSGDILNFFIIV
jgi:hypothetical protein